MSNGSSFSNEKFFSLEAEVNLLGSIINHNPVMAEVFGKVKPEHFYKDGHKLLYNAMTEIYLEGGPIDVVTLINKLGSRLSEAGGITYISSTISSAYFPQNAVSYADIICEKAKDREIKRILQAAALEAQGQDTKLQKIASEVQESLFRIEGEESEEDGNMEKSITEFLNILEKRYKGEDAGGIKCGYRGIDGMINGFCKQDLIIIAARPSMGKTALALNFALNSSITYCAKTAFFNLEMGKQQVLERAMAVCTGISLNKIKKGELEDEEWSRVGEKSNMLYSSGLKIYDKIITLKGIWAECRRLKERSGLDIVFIDYLQLIESEEKAENRNIEISKISRQLKLMAKKLNITVVALSQLSRAAEARVEHRPRLSDLRESGSIEQDADIVMLLYRDEYYDSETEIPGILECIISKNRNGEVGTVRLKWNARYQKVEP